MTDHQNFSTAVENLQRYLRQISYEEPSIPPLSIDGIFEARTEAALREFQRLRGLSITGSADRETWDRLYRDYRASLASNSPPRAILIFPPSPTGYVLSPGSIGFPVEAIQRMLLELQHHDKELENVAQTGVYDEQTQAAIQSFQKKNALPIDNGVGVLTWNTLADQYNALFSRIDDE
ncbi:MAG: peptidoglycan-binding protein [Clostridia bacterium]|nr:peptidoglycan-binding protein [Clostridia bacterium]